MKNGFEELVLEKETKIVIDEVTVIAEYNKGIVSTTQSTLLISNKYNKTNTKEITIEELSELLELGTWFIGYKGYVITEEFENKENRVYSVEDLHIIIEQDIVMFYDSEYNLTGSVLMGQLRKNILNVYHSYIGKYLHENIVFSTGCVNIDAIAA